LSRLTSPEVGESQPHVSGQRSRNPTLASSSQYSLASAQLSMLLLPVDRLLSVLNSCSLFWQDSEALAMSRMFPSVRDGKSFKNTCSARGHNPFPPEKLSLNAMSVMISSWIMSILVEGSSLNGGVGEYHNLPVGSKPNTKSVFPPHSVFFISELVSDTFIKSFEKNSRAQHRKITFTGRSQCWNIPDTSSLNGKGSISSNILSNMHGEHSSYTISSTSKMNARATAFKINHSTLDSMTSHREPTNKMIKAIAVRTAAMNDAMNNR
jgi:hypothetical protein